MVKVGSTLSATPASVTGDPTPIRSWQWLRDNVTISGATAADYYVQAADEGSKLSVRQIETNFVGVASATSAQTATVGAYDPGTLFESGEVGAWYDPSDSTTVFQDAAGTTPAGVGDPVGLILDKSQGLTLGSELWPGASITVEAGWTDNGDGSYTGTATSNRVFSTVGMQIDKLYVFTLTVSGYVSGSVIVGTGSTFNDFNITGNGTYSRHVRITTATAGAAVFDGVAFTGTISSLSVKELPGNHATQTTSAARPILQQSGATPVLSGTELVTNGAFDTDTDWTKASGWSISSGEASFDGSAVYANFSQNMSLVQGKFYKITFDLTGAISAIRLGGASSANNVAANLTTGSISITASCIGSDGTLYIVSQPSVATTIDNISVQEVTSWSGGLRYLDFDGVDDFLATAAFASAQPQPNTIAVAAAVSTVSGRFLVDAEQGGTGRHVIYNPSVDLAVYAGTAMIASGANTGNVAVWNALFDTTSSYLRKNGTAVTLSNSTVGTFNWSGITIGARNSATSNSNSDVYSFVGVNRTLTAAEITDLETYLASKSGVTLP